MKILSRHDIAQRTDRATRATTLRYVGRGLSWTNVLYGEPEGVFFVLSASEVPLPTHLVPLAEAAGILLDDHPDVSRLHALVETCLIAEAWVETPTLLKDLASLPTRWLDTDRIALERKHQTAVYALEDHVALIERDLRRRILSRSIGAPLPSAPAPMVTPEVAAPEVSDAAVRRVDEATSQARNAELPQRLPGGARRQLERLEHGRYVSANGAFTKHEDTAAAMRAAVKVAGESVVIDWDGEWPVVVRRYDAGRVIYRVEDALRRAGEENEEHAA